MVGLVLVLVVAGCGETYEQDAPAQHAADAPSPAPAPPTTSSATPAGTTVLAGVGFTPPSSWGDVGADGMRQAQYRLAPVDGDSAEAEVNVFYFGPSSGGGVEANLQRWVGQMILPEGTDPATAIARDTFTADGMPGHVVTLDGSYKSGGGRPMAGDVKILPGYRLVGVVVEGPQGSLFFKLTGPVATAKAMEGDLLAMVKAATR